MLFRALKAGDRVKLLRIPPQVSSDLERLPETFELFQKAVGRLYWVRSFGDYGHIELWLSDDGSEDEKRIAHSIWVEPEFLLAV